MVPPVMVHVALRMTYTPPPYSAAVLPEMVPPDMLKTWAAYTPPPRLVAKPVTAASVVKLPEIEPPVMLNVPAVYTPAPSSSDELPETVPPDRVNTPLYTYTPPPYLALLPETLPPSMRNVLRVMYTPPPFSAFPRLAAVKSASSSRLAPVVA